MPENHKTLTDSSVDNIEQQLQLLQMKYVAIAEAKYVTAISIFASEANLKSLCMHRRAYIYSKCTLPTKIQAQFEQESPFMQLLLAQFFIKLLKLETEADH